MFASSNRDKYIIVTQVNFFYQVYINIHASIDINIACKLDMATSSYS